MLVTPGSERVNPSSANGRTRRVNEKWRRENTLGPSSLSRVFLSFALDRLK